MTGSCFFCVKSVPYFGKDYCLVTSGYAKTKILNTPARMTGRTGIIGRLLMTVEGRAVCNFFAKSNNIGRHKFTQPAPQHAGNYTAA